jgi:hypothetical protein
LRFWSSWSLIIKTLKIKWIQKYQFCHFIQCGLFPRVHIINIPLIKIVSFIPLNTTPPYLYTPLTRANPSCHVAIGIQLSNGVSKITWLQSFKEKILLRSTQWFFTWDMHTPRCTQAATGGYAKGSNFSIILDSGVRESQKVENYCLRPKGVQT